MKHSEHYKVISYHVGYPHAKHVRYFEDYGEVYDFYFNIVTTVGWRAMVYRRGAFGRWVRIWSVV